jgi:hypothetical protein
LTRLVVLREEFPEFYRKLEIQEDLLRHSESYIRNSTESIPKYITDDLATLLKNERLLNFLRATLGIICPSVAVFINLAEEKFEGVVTDKETFLSKISQGVTAYFISKLEGGDSAQASAYIESILSAINKYVKTRNFIFATNCMNVLLEAYQHIPEVQRRLVIGTIGKLIQYGEIQPLINRLNVAKLFELIPNFTGPQQDYIIESYAKLLKDNDRLNKELLEQVINLKEIVRPEIIDKFVAAIISLLKVNEDAGEEALRRLTEDGEVRRLFIRPAFIDALIDKITLMGSSPNLELIKKRIGRYLTLKDLASEENKLFFIKRMTEMLTIDGHPTTSGVLSLVIDVLAELRSNDVPKEGASILYESLKVVFEKTKNNSDKMTVVSIEFAAFNGLDENKRKEFLLDNIVPLLRSSNTDNIVKTITFDKIHQSQILRYDGIVDGFADMIKSHGISNPYIAEYLADDSPDDKKEKIAGIFRDVIMNHKPEDYKSVGYALRTHHKKFLQISTLYPQFSVRNFNIFKITTSV